MQFSCVNSKRDFSLYSFGYPSDSMKIITLATCHNRAGSTLAALSDLHEQVLPEDVCLSHVIVDDGSTDGTSESVGKAFPGVEIVQGNGNLFWAGGMRHGWEQAISGGDFDYLFVYNDDVRLNVSAISCLLEASKNLQQASIVVGSFLGDDGLTTVYGGRRHSSRWHPLKFAEIVEPDGTLQQADTLNMNGALISSAALATVGFLSGYFVHSGADFEYGLKLRKSGGIIVVARDHIGHCALNPDSTFLPQYSETLSGSLTLLFDQKREPFRQRWCFYRQHGGWFWPILWISPYLTVWFRFLYQNMTRSKRSAISK
jgi:GT2 family glycosyltransferase